MTRRSTDLAKVYREAARLIEKQARHSDAMDGYPRVKFSCCAIAEAEGIFPLWNHGKAHSDLIDRYGVLFDGNFGSEWESQNQAHRIVALCMMAAMVEAGDA